MQIGWQITDKIWKGFKKPPSKTYCHKKKKYPHISDFCYQLRYISEGLGGSEMQQPNQFGGWKEKKKKREK